VQLPDGFDWRMQSGSFAAWRNIGLKRADGDAMLAQGLSRGPNKPILARLT